MPGKFEVYAPDITPEPRKFEVYAPEKTEPKEEYPITRAFVKAALPGLPFGEDPETQRHLIRTASRIGESLADIPGGLLELGAKGVDIATQGLQKIGLMEQPTNLAGAIPEAIKPGSFKKNITEPAFGELQQPKNKTESLLDDFTQLATELAVPMPIVGGTPIKKAAGMAGLASGAGFMAKELLPEGFAGPIKAGTLIATSLLSHKAPRAQAKEMFKDVGNVLSEIPKNQHMPLTNKPVLDYLAELDKLRQRGRLGSSAAAIKDTINNALTHESISPMDLWKSKKELNNVFRALPDARSEAATEIHEGITKAKEALNEFGAMHNKPIIDKLNAADEIERAYHATTKLGNLLPGPLKKLADLNPLTVILAGGGVGLPFRSAIPGAITLAGVGLDQFSQTMQLLFKSPAVRKAYTKMWKGVAAENKALVGSGFKELNAAINDEYSNPD